MSQTEKLETEKGMRCRALYVIQRHARETDAEAQAAAGIEPTTDDLVVMITRFSSPAEQRLISEQSASG